MLLFSAIIRQFHAKRKAIHDGDMQLKATNFQNHSYGSWMGLFKSFGLSHGNDPGQAPGSGTYIPLTRLTTGRIARQASNEYVHHGEIVERESERIAKVLTRNAQGDITDTLTYSIREIIRNVIEHSQAAHIWYAAQCWPTKDRVEIGILDEGIGLRQSLLKNPTVEVATDETALFLSIQPGVSGTKRMRGRSPDGHWGNSGYGLFMTSSLAKKGGDFIICSGERALHLNENHSEFLPCSYTGTAIRMVIDTTRIESLYGALERLRRLGEEISRDYGGKQEVTASKMSRMLSRNN
ncbi:MAG TPA: hypothetical protein PKJ63_16880 [Cyclobacteriaceae bacterium]|nr:hypothetical protein [Cyclobacteriaceae bacterium]